MDTQGIFVIWYTFCNQVITVFSRLFQCDTGWKQKQKQTWLKSEGPLSVMGWGPIILLMLCQSQKRTGRADILNGEGSKKGRDFFLFLQPHCTYLHFIQQHSCLLQWDRSTAQLGCWLAGHLQQPLAQLLRHLPVALPLVNPAVNDPPHLLCSANYSLPLIAQKSQIQIKFIPITNR